MARDADPARAREQPEPIVEAAGDLVRRERAHAGRGELDREGNAVEATADLRDRHAVRGRDPERRRGSHCALGEQANGVELAELLNAGAVHRGQRQRWDRKQRLAGDPEALPAGGEHPDTGACTQERVGDLRTGTDHLFAVVEQDERLMSLEMLDERRQERTAGLLPHSQR